MRPSFRTVTFCILGPVLIVLVIVLVLVWTMPDLPSSVSSNTQCLPTKQGYLVCEDTAQGLHDYLQRVIPVSYDEVKRKEEVQKKKFFSEKIIHFTAIYDTYFWEIKQAAKLTGKELPANSKSMREISRVHVIPVSYDEVKRKEEVQKKKFFSEKIIHFTAIYDTFFWEIKPAAKLTGKELPANSKKQENGDMTPIHVWRQGRDIYGTNGFLRYGVQYRNGRLVVPTSGTYFIYSYVDLFEECDPITGTSYEKNASEPLRHAMFKFNILDRAETEVVSNVQPRVISRNWYYNSYSSFVSSLADLKAGDEISVKVSNISYIRYTRNNYFGLNLIKISPYGARPRRGGGAA